MASNVVKYVIIVVLTSPIFSTAQEHWDYEEHQDTPSGITSNKNLVERLWRREKDIVEVLQGFLARERQKISVLKWYLESYKVLNEKQTKFDEKEFLEHPINIYKVVDHVTYKWPMLKEALAYSSYETEDIIENVRLQRDEFQGGKVDSYEAAYNLVRLQSTFDLEIPEMANGKLCNSQRNCNMTIEAASLNAFDCLQMSVNNVDGRNLDEARQWLELAKQKVLIGDDSTGNEFIEEQQNRLSSLSMENGTLYREASKLKNMTDDQVFSISKSKIFSDDIIENEVYQRLCKESDFRPKTVTKNLKCWLKSSENVYFIIRPLKIEDVSLDPSIFMIHDIINRKEMNKFKDLINSEEHSNLVSMVTEEDSPHRVVDTKVRTGVNTWIGDEDGDEMRKLTKKFEMATGMKMSNMDFSAEAYQVASYPPGGRYITHMDAFENADRYHPDDFNKTNACGDRFSTFMIYLSEVKAGGSTVFPVLGTSVKPVKGSALIWWNLKHDGSVDFRTRHGGCPVLLGSKYIANKWICFNSQFLKKPCLSKVS